MSRTSVLKYAKVAAVIVRNLAEARARNQYKGAAHQGAKPQIVTKIRMGINWINS